VDLHGLFRRNGGVLLAKVFSSAVLGIDAYRVEVEVDITSGLPTYTTIGPPCLGLAMDRWSALGQMSLHAETIEDRERGVEAYCLIPRSSIISC